MKLIAYSYNLLFFKKYIFFQLPLELVSLVSAVTMIELCLCRFEN